MTGTTGESVEWRPAVFSVRSAESPNGGAFIPGASKEGHRLARLARSRSVFGDLAPPYRTIVADPPWSQGDFNGWGSRRDLPYSTMTTEDIAALPVGSLVEREGYLFLWTTNKFLEAGFAVCRAWGFTPRQTLTWCKQPNGKGLGGMFAATTEFVIVGQAIREGTNAHGSRTNQDRAESTWFEWKRGKHSAKPAAFFDLVERVSPGPYVELFARSRRLGWDGWGDES